MTKSDRRHLHLVPDPDSEATPEFTDTTFTMTELQALEDEDLDQLEALRDEIEGTAVWWALWRLEQAEKGCD